MIDPSIAKHKLATAKLRFSLCLIADQEKVLSESLAKELSARAGISVRHFWRIYSEYKKHPVLATCLAKPDRLKRAKVTRLSKKQEEIIEDHIFRLHIEKVEKVSLPDILEQINLACERAQEDTISLSTVERRLKDLPGRVKASAQRKKTGVKPIEHRPGRLVTNYPLELLQIDHTLVDKMLDLSAYGLGISRPWLTLIIDIHTRCIYGYSLSLLKPNSEACALAMMMGFIPKNSICVARGANLAPFQARDIEEPWPIYGAPTSINYDNALEFTRGLFPDGLAMLGISAYPRVVGQPHLGGHIERLMGTFMKSVHGLSGTTFSNVMEKGNYNSESNAGMTFEEFELWLVLQILRYHMRVHSSLGCSPYTKFQLEKHKMPTRRISIEDARRCFMKRATRTIQGCGIMHKHRWYQNDQLRYFLGEQVHIAWQDNDLSHIWVSIDNATDHIKVPLAPGQLTIAHGDIWYNTRPRKGRVLEDKRQLWLSAELLEAQLKLDQKTKRLGHRPLRPHSLPPVPDEMSLLADAGDVSPIAVTAPYIPVVGATDE